MKFGAHVSIAGGIDKAPERAYKMGCECFQIFTRSPRGGTPPKLDSSVLDSFFRNCDKYGFEDYYVHTPYFVNLASDQEGIRTRSIDIIKEDLERSSLLRAKYVMTHLGSSKGMSREKAIRNVIESIQSIFDGTQFYTKLLLENSAGQGDTVGETFEELAEIIEGSEIEDIYVCLDTAHLLAAGYDIRDDTSLGETIEKIEKSFGTDRVKLLHGNDSKVGLGEKKDRHEFIGKGKIGIEGFRSIIKNNVFSKLNMIVETKPEGMSEDIKTLKKLREEVTQGINQ